MYWLAGVIFFPQIRGRFTMMTCEVYETRQEREEAQLAAFQSKWADPRSRNGANPFVLDLLRSMPRVGPNVVRGISAICASYKANRGNGSTMELLAIANVLEELSGHPGCHETILSSLGPLSAFFSALEISSERGRDLVGTMGAVLVNLVTVNSSEIVGDKKLIGVLVKFLGKARGNVPDDHYWMGTLVVALSTLLATERSAVFPLLSKTSSINALSSIFKTSSFGKDEAHVLTILSLIRMLVEGLEGSENVRAFISNGVLAKVASCLSSSDTEESESSVEVFAGLFSGGEMGDGYYEETGFRTVSVVETLGLVPSLVQAALNLSRGQENAQRKLFMVIGICMMHPDPTVRGRNVGRLLDTGFFAKKQLRSGQWSKCALELLLDLALSAEQWVKRARQGGEMGAGETDPLGLLESVAKMCSQVTRHPEVLNRLISCGDHLGVNDSGSPVLSPQSQLGVLMEAARRIIEFLGKRAGQSRGRTDDVKEAEAKIAMNATVVLMGPLSTLSPEVLPAAAIVNMGVLPLLIPHLACENFKLVMNVVGMLDALLVRDRAARECAFASSSACERLIPLKDALRAMVQRVASADFDPVSVSVALQADGVAMLIPVFVAIMCEGTASGKRLLAEMCEIGVDGSATQEEMLELAHEWASSFLCGASEPLKMGRAQVVPGVIPTAWTLPRCSNPACPAPTDCPLHRCARCGTVKYCGAACQKADWKVHKSACAAASSSKKAGGGKKK